jgi:hypothetical protein
MSPTNKNKKSPFIVSKEAIIKVITESEIYPEIGKFIKQQSKIQWLLASLIFYRLAPESNRYEWILKNKNLLKNIASSTTGHLLEIYTPYSENEKIFLKKLKEYNKLRNELIHKFFPLKEETLNFKKEKEYINQTIKIGEEIEKMLLNQLKKEKLL